METAKPPPASTWSQRSLQTQSTQGDLSTQHIDLAQSVPAETPEDTKMPARSPAAELAERAWSSDSEEEGSYVPSPEKSQASTALVADDWVDDMQDSNDDLDDLRFHQLVKATAHEELIDHQSDDVPAFVLLSDTTNDYLKKIQFQTYLVSDCFSSISKAWNDHDVVGLFFLFVT